MFLTRQDSKLSFGQEYFAQLHQKQLACRLSSDLGCKESWDTDCHLRWRMSFTHSFNCTNNREQSSNASYRVMHLKSITKTLLSKEMSSKNNKRASLFIFISNNNTSLLADILFKTSLDSFRCNEAIVGRMTVVRVSLAWQRIPLISVIVCCPVIGRNRILVPNVTWKAMELH